MVLHVYLRANSEASFPTTKSTFLKITFSNYQLHSSIYSISNGTLFCTHRHTLHKSECNTTESNSRRAEQCNVIHRDIINPIYLNTQQPSQKSDNPIIHKTINYIYLFIYMPSIHHIPIDPNMFQKFCNVSLYVYMLSITTTVLVTS